VDVVPLLQARSLTKRVKAGGSATLTGTVRPDAAVRVLVERKGTSGRWRRVSEVPVKVSKQRFVARVGLRGAGLYRLTPRTGSTASPVAAPALYVRAVR
jgi:hypothetical protein